MPNLENEMKRYQDMETKKILERFFKTWKWEYGEWDVFLWIKVPKIRKIVKDYYDTNLKELEKYMHSKYHELRLGTVIILTKKYEKAKTQQEKKEILDFYVKNLDFVNNWDLVDISAQHIVWKAILDGIIEENFLDDFVKSENIWYQRVAIISTLALIKNGNFSKTLEISQKLLNSKVDLIQKALWWMWREIWKKDNEIVEKFIIKNYDQIPRTSLRYAIEKMDEEKRKRFLRKEF